MGLINSFCVIISLTPDWSSTTGMIMEQLATNSISHPHIIRLVLVGQFPTPFQRERVLHATVYTHCNSYYNCHPIRLPEGCHVIAKECKRVAITYMCKPFVLSLAVQQVTIACYDRLCNNSRYVVGATQPTVMQSV